MNIGVFFEEQNVNSLKEDTEMFIGIYSVIAQSESENISGNVRWGIQKGDDGEPEIVPEEAEIVRKIFRQYLDGSSLDQLKSYLEKIMFSLKKEIPFGRSP